VYKRLVEGRVGVAGARDLLAIYFIPGMGHGAEYDASLAAQLDALEAWWITAKAAATPARRLPMSSSEDSGAIRATDDERGARGTVPR
jgi:hypothetical protein